MDQIYEDALALHEKHHGKLEIKSKVPVTNKTELSLAYTPGVGQVCLEINQDKRLVKKYTIKRNTIAVVTDGSAVLGLGNLGPEAALPVMEGKAVLFKEFADVDAFPICLDTQDTEEIIKAVKLIAPVFGGINLEDIAAPRCFEIEKRLKAELNIPVMHDDQHGTATVVLAALINAIKLADKGKETVRIVINGAGAAGSAIAKLLSLYGFNNLVVVDSQGIIHPERQGLNEEKKELANLTNQNNLKGDLSQALTGADVFIGVSKAGALPTNLVKLMAPKSIIFAMANPIPEIMPDDARAAGAFIIATGRSDFANQINNVLAFPGIFRGALDNSVTQITNTMLVKAAEALANLVTNPKTDKLLPEVFEPGVAQAVAQTIK